MFQGRKRGNWMEQAGKYVSYGSNYLFVTDDKP
jgi:hypothetical protein